MGNKKRGGGGWLHKCLKRFRQREEHFDIQSINTWYSKWELKKLIFENGLALDSDGNVSWFYSTALNREFTDPLLNRSLNYIKNNFQKDSRILVTGCGTGIIPFHLYESGFQKIEGRDLLKNCIQVAQKLSEIYYSKKIIFRTEDGFKPKFSEKYACITAMHWIFSAWMGNYGNKPAENPFDQENRNRLLSDFLNKYSAGLESNGILIIELTDSVADYRDTAECPSGVYPVRFSPADVENCAEMRGFRVLEKHLSVRYGHQPRTAYYLQKLI